MKSSIMQLIPIYLSIYRDIIIVGIIIKLLLSIKLYIKKMWEVHHINHILPFVAKEIFSNNSVYITKNF